MTTGISEQTLQRTGSAGPDPITSVKRGSLPETVLNGQSNGNHVNGATVIKTDASQSVSRSPEL